MAETVADIPALAALWDPEMNEEPAADVLARSYRTAWWKCPSGHSFERKPPLPSSLPKNPQDFPFPFGKPQPTSEPKKAQEPPKSDTPAK